MLKANGSTINEKRVGLPELQYVKYLSSLCMYKCFRDQAQSYVYEPDSVDSRRGLKLSWTNRKVDEPNPSGSKVKATSEEKGTLLRTFIFKGIVNVLTYIFPQTYNTECNLA